MAGGEPGFRRDRQREENAARSVNAVPSRRHAPSLLSGRARDERASTRIERQVARGQKPREVGAFVARAYAPIGQDGRRRLVDVEPLGALSDIRDPLRERLGVVILERDGEIPVFIAIAILALVILKQQAGGFHPRQEQEREEGDDAPTDDHWH